MSDAAEEPSGALLCCTLLGFAFVSWFLWKCVLSRQQQRPPTTATAARTGATSSSSRSTSTPASSSAPGASSSSSAAARTTPSRSRSSSTSSAKDADDDDDDDAFAFGRPRRPPHLLVPDETLNADMSGCLLHGVVPFRSTPASTYESQLKIYEGGGGEGDNDEMIDPVVTNRRERARIFARMFSAAAGGGGRPPNRGANVVVAIHRCDTSCPKLQKALFLLGTYYNLFVLIDGAGAMEGVATKGREDREKEERALVKRLRSELLNQGATAASTNNEYRLNSKILPPHRIAFSSTSAGRVAFVRQLNPADLVVERDSVVSKELERFGFRVLLYPTNSSTSEEEEEGGASDLGRFLIP